MFLVINTVDNNKFYLALLDKDSGQVYDSQVTAAPFAQEEYFLKTLTVLLQKNKKHIKDISGLVVVNGEGSFSSLRIGITIANALAWALAVPVISINSKDFNSDEVLYKLAWQKLSNPVDLPEFVIPEYDREPNIT